jgi:protein-tyrosine-phosphatase
LTLEQAEPRDLDDILQPSDLIVSVCDAVNEKIARKPNPRLHWSIPDPARIGTDAAFAETFEEIRTRVVALAPHVNCPPN